MDIATFTEFFKNFGFPIAVAVWALWRLDKSWGKGESIHATIAGLEETLEELLEMAKKNAEIQTELVITMKIIQTIIGGETRR